MFSSLGAAGCVICATLYAAASYGRNTYSRWQSGYRPIATDIPQAHGTYESKGLYRYQPVKTDDMDYGTGNGGGYGTASGNGHGKGGGVAGTQEGAQLEFSESFNAEANAEPAGDSYGDIPDAEPDDL